MKYTIEDIRKGICAVHNDGTIEELKEVLLKAFPEKRKRIMELAGNFTLYHRSEGDYINCTDALNLPFQSVKKFLENIPKKGDKILVSNYGHFVERIFLQFIEDENCKCKVLAVSERDGADFLAGATYDCVLWRNWKPIEKSLPEVQVTMDEIAKLLKIDVKQLKIKK